MKKILTWLLLLSLLLPSAALAGWEEGLGPGKPYANLPEIDLGEKMGYMIFTPDEGLAAQHACQWLRVYLPREDVALGEGTLILYEAGGREVWRTEMANAEAVTLRALNESELEGLLWGGGTCVEARLPRTLTLGQTYFLNLTHGAIVSDSGVESAQIGGEDSWRFTVEGDFGVSGMRYCRDDAEDLLTPQAGDEIRFDLTLGDAAMAVIYGSNQSVDFVTSIFTEDQEVIGLVTGEELSWGVIFLDAQGQELGRVNFN